MTDETNETWNDEALLVTSDEADVQEDESSDVPADADVPAVPDAILGATDAETPDVEPLVEASAETPTEKYARLLAEGVKPSRITVITNSAGGLIEARVQ